ncbi:MAG TPA: mechanosensitive ion channel domain-containing protein [Phaeodactylibacter sp.]|nr:mechanosensitive ion channel domain-containing protein [Phaeodactylibacter sp.]
MQNILDQLLESPYAWLIPLGKTILAALAGYFAAWIIFRLLGHYGKKREWLPLKSANQHLRRPGLWLGAIIVLMFVVPNLGFSEEVGDRLNLIVEIFLYIFGSWLIIEFTDVVADLVRDRFRIGESDNLSERKIITQFAYIKRVVSAIVVIVAIAFILLQFDAVRELGTGLLTSAGVAGIIVGLAAQKSIANLLAGFQLAFTQPIRIDDVVIVENEWGRIEEITLTYVIVRIWDERRLVVPLNYFNEKPFQNWTRASSELLAYVYLYADYRLPVQALREELDRLLEDEPLWDERVKNVQVTNADRSTLEVRALMSARNASDAWDLRCKVREQLIAFIQENYPESLPRTRVELPAGDTPSSQYDKKRRANHQEVRSPGGERS